MHCYLIDKAGVRLIVEPQSKNAVELIDLALGAMRPAKVAAPSDYDDYATSLRVDYVNEHWVLGDSGSALSYTLKMPGDLIYHLTDRIVFHIADKSSESHCLHAASVAYNGRAMVIPANSGAGKSSFTTWLAANGFDYLTDELILVDKHKRLDGVARPIQIKPHGIDAVSALIKDPSLIQHGYIANAIPAAALGASLSDCDQHALAMFVFPQYRSGAEYDFRRLSAAEAGMNLMANHVNARSLEGHGFREMMQIIRNTPCYYLEYGGFDTLPSGFAEQLQALLRSDHART